MSKAPVMKKASAGGLPKIREGTFHHLYFPGTGGGQLLVVGACWLAGWLGPANHPRSPPSQLVAKDR